MLVDTGRELVLVDTGGGAAGRGRLVQSMREGGFSPTDIDVIVVTHLHGDHVGGLSTPEGALVFPRARHVLSRDEWDWATSFDFSALPAAARTMLEPPIARFKDVFAAHANQFDLVGDGDKIAPGIIAVLAPGHTPGHMALRVSSQGQVLLH